MQSWDPRVSQWGNLAESKKADGAVCNASQVKGKGHPRPIPELLYTKGQGAGLPCCRQCHETCLRE